MRVNTMYLEIMYQLSPCVNPACTGGLITSQCVVDLCQASKILNCSPDMAASVSSLPRRFRTGGFIFAASRRYFATNTKHISSPCIY